MSKRIPLFYTITAIFWFALYAYVPYISPYGEYLGADLRFIGLIVGAYGFTQMLIRFPLGILSDRLGKRKIFVLGGLFFAAISGVVVFIVPSSMALLISRSLGGVAAASWVTFTILGASYYSPEETSKSMGYLNSANALGRILAFLAGGLIAQWMGVPYAFLLGGLAGGVGLIAGLWIRDDAKSKNNCECPDNKIEKTPKISELLLSISNKQLLIASLMAIICMYISFATNFGFTPLLAENLGANSFQLGMLGMSAALPGLFVSPLAGTVMPKKLGSRNTIMIGFTLTAIGCCLLIFSTNLVQLYMIQVIISTGTAIAYTLLMSLSIMDIPAKSRATGMGFFQAVYGIGMFVGPFLTGWIAHGFGLSIAFGFTSGVGLIGVILACMFIQKTI